MKHTDGTKRPRLFNERANAEEINLVISSFVCELEQRMATHWYSSCLYDLASGGTISPEEKNEWDAFQYIRKLLHLMLEEVEEYKPFVFLSIAQQSYMLEAAGTVLDPNWCQTYGVHTSSEVDEFTIHPPVNSTFNFDELGLIRR